MQQATLMNLKVLLPFGLLVDRTGVSRIVAVAHDGSFGILPLRLDCVATLVPGILTYECAGDSEVYVAVDEGVLVKAGFEVLVCARNAVSGSDLGQLQETVRREFVHLNKQEQNIRSIIAKMESGFIQRLAEFQRD